MAGLSGFCEEILNQISIFYIKNSNFLNMDVFIYVQGPNKSNYNTLPPQTTFNLNIVNTFHITLHLTPYLHLITLLSLSLSLTLHYLQQHLIHHKALLDTWRTLDSFYKLSFFLRSGSKDLKVGLCPPERSNSFFLRSGSKDLKTNKRNYIIRYKHKNK